MQYKDLKLKTKEDTVIARVNNIDIEVLQYLPILDKIDLIQIALQKSEENGIYNEMKLDMYFHLYIIYMYTNLEFSDEDRLDEATLYDELNSNDIIIGVLGALDDNEYNTLLDYLTKMKFANVTYRHSAAAVIQTIIQDLPKNMSAAAEIMESFDAEKYKEVASFAEAANAGRPISTIQ